MVSLAMVRCRPLLVSSLRPPSSSSFPLTRWRHQSRYPRRASPPLPPEQKINNTTGISSIHLRTKKWRDFDDFFLLNQIVSNYLTEDQHYNRYRASPKKCNPPLFPLFLQTSLSNIKNDFMVKKNDILEINCNSFNEILSSMSKL